MDWVKLGTSYDEDPAVAALDDAGEVMFTRGIAYCGRAETGGFVPDAVLPRLCRRPSKATRVAATLTAAGLWERVDGGYQVARWDPWQEGLEALVKRRKSDRARQRKHREQSRDVSRDSHVTVTPPREEREVEAAAAALTPALDVLRGRMTAHTALASLRWDTLSDTQAAEIEQLISIHGDARLVDVALRTCRTPPPTLVSAFIGTWRALPAPGQPHLRVVEHACPDHPHELARNCRACAAERLAGERP